MVVAVVAVAVIVASYTIATGSHGNPPASGIRDGASLVGGYTLPSPAGEAAGAVAIGPIGGGIAIQRKQLEKMIADEDIPDRMDQDPQPDGSFDDSGSRAIKAALANQYTNYH